MDAVNELNELCKEVGNDLNDFTFTNSEGIQNICKSCGKMGDIVISTLNDSSGKIYMSMICPHCRRSLKTEIIRYGLKLTVDKLEIGIPLGVTIHKFTFFEKLKNLFQ